VEVESTRVVVSIRIVVVSGVVVVTAIRIMAEAPMDVRSPVKTMIVRGYERMPPVRVAVEVAMAAH